MLRKTYYIENPAALSIELEQLVIQLGADRRETRPLDDAGMVVIDNHQVTLTSPLLQGLARNQVGLVVCDQKHMPAGIWLPLSGHIQTGGRTRAQLEAGKPLNKKLWQITVKAKIANQARVLRQFGRPTATLERLAQSVRSGDTTNSEATAAAYYWKHWLTDRPDFRRDPDGEPPNHLLNFGYAVLRSMTARYLIGSGLWPVYGMFHVNMYNVFPLADDVMEPYRPIVDILVANLVESNPDAALDVFMSRETRTSLLSIAFVDVDMGETTRPLQNALQQTCASLAKAYEEKEAQLLTYPRLSTSNGL